MSRDATGVSILYLDEAPCLHITSSHGALLVIFNDLLTPATGADLKIEEAPRPKGKNEFIESKTKWKKERWQR